MDELFTSALEMITGVKTDLMTIVLGLIGMVLVLVAFEYLRNIIEDQTGRMRFESDEREAEKYRKEMYDVNSSRFRRDVARRQYTNLVNRHSRRR